MIRGKGVSTGIGFGTIVVLKNQERQIEKKTVEDPEKEMKRFKEALEQVTKETEEIVNTSSGTEKEIMSAYLMIMQDPTLTTETENAITNLNYSAEYAVEPLELVFSEPTPDEVMKQAFAAFFLVKPRIAVQTCCSTLLDLIVE